MIDRLPAGPRVLLGNRAVYGWLIVAFGVALRLRQYFEFLSMGNDEAALARNIVERDFLGLAQPLDYRQGAPILFLFIQKLAILLFGNRDYVLAIFPLVSGLLALYFFYRISEHYLGWSGLIALYAFACSRQIINYTSVQKQYSSDVLIAVVLIYLYAEVSSRMPRSGDFVQLGLAGALGIWLAHPTVFILPGIGLAMLIRGWMQRDRLFLAGTLAVGAAWAASLAANFLLSLRGLAADPYFATYWKHAFMPWPVWSNPAWFTETYVSLLYMSINRTGPPLVWGWLIVGALGIVAMWFRRRALACILLLTFVVSLAASALHLYPLRFRLLLFLLPSMYLLLAEGVRRLFQVIAGFSARTAWFVCATLCGGLLWPSAVDARQTLLEPVRLYEMRGIVQHVRSNWKEGDGILVSGGGETFAYYSRSMGLESSPTIIDTNHRIIRYGAYMDYLDRLSANERVWVIFAYFEQDPSYTRYSDYLAKQGAIDHVEILGFSRAYLWIPKQRITARYHGMESGAPLSWPFSNREECAPCCTVGTWNDAQVAC